MGAFVLQLLVSVCCSSALWYCFPFFRARIPDEAGALDTFVRLDVW